MNESNLFESGRKYRFVEILISNYLFVSLFVSIVDKYSREIDLLHKKMLLNCCLQFVFGNLKVREIGKERIKIRGRE